MKKYFILSDVHSRYDLLVDALIKSDFDFENDSHMLVIAGDILDRGYQGDEVIRFLEKLIVKNRVMACVGNHDVFLIDLLNEIYDLDKISWNMNRNGFIKTILLGWDKKDDDWNLNYKNLEEVKLGFWNKYPIFVNWIIGIPTYLEFSNHVIVHAFLDFSLPDWHDTDRNFAVWERRYDDKLPDDFNKILIFGHTPNIYIDNQNDIIYKDNKIMLDGGAASNIQINVLVLDEEKI